jgi:hypothetical protein
VHGWVPATGAGRPAARTAGRPAPQAAPPPAGTSHWVVGGVQLAVEEALPHRRRRRRRVAVLRSRWRTVEIEQSLVAPIDGYEGLDGGSRTMIDWIVSTYAVRRDPTGRVSNRPWRALPSLTSTFGRRRQPRPAGTARCLGERTVTASAGRVHERDARRCSSRTAALGAPRRTGATHVRRLSDHATTPCRCFACSRARLQAPTVVTAGMWSSTTGGSWCGVSARRRHACPPRRRLT